jgi:hypothetical protein
MIGIISLESINSLHENARWDNQFYRAFFSTKTKTEATSNSRWLTIEYGDNEWRIHSTETRRYEIGEKVAMNVKIEA